MASNKFKYLGLDRLSRKFRVSAPSAKPAWLLVLAGITLMAVVIAVILWGPRCEKGRRIALGEALLLGGL